MECNKDDAMRAKEIAEKKMMNNDFEGGKKFALKAQNLYPALENINQLLSICDVHCSAQRTMVGSDKDWYGILQTEKFADEVAVKKQYRRLALFLHPDKNRFPGAEAAFKLICEANAVLSDPLKKSIYDNKVKVIVRSASVVPPPHHMNKNSQFSQQYGGHVKVSNAYSTLNQHQSKQTSFSVKQGTFWTVCPFCSVKYQCERKHLGSTMRCQKCLKAFTTHEIGTQAVPVKPNVSQSYAFQEKGAHTQGPFKAGVQTGQGVSTSNAGFQWSSRGQAAQANVQTESIFKGKQEGKASQGGMVGQTSNGHANNKKTSKPKNKRKRDEFIVESSESCDSTSESDSEDVTILEKNLNPGPSQVQSTRRSSRNRQNVSYNEADDDDNVLLSSLKKSRGSKLSEEKENDTLNGESKSHDLPTNGDSSKPESKETREKESDDVGADATEIESDSDVSAQYEESEFYDFEKDRAVARFAVNQFWACYDSVDGMPRFYAKIKKVCVSPFELSITWLEADPVDDEQQKWLNEDLPIGCGNFKFGETEPSSRLMFSHQVHFPKGKKRGSFIIQPRMGEVWAIFKDWDSSWSADPENHRVYKYEVVEVESDFEADIGSRVCYLTKIEGFVSLFQRSNLIRNGSFLIRPSEMYKFSHRIPCHKMRGNEREGVPIGSFELDPASLPLSPDDLYYPGK